MAAIASAKSAAMFMADTLTLDGPRRDNAGNLVASVLAARTGCQDYAGFEVGKPELAKVTVYRPADEVFSRDSMRSFAGAPVTIEHPAEPVTPTNWKDHAVGEVSEEIVRDGEAVRVPFMLRDAKGIAAVEAGKREISMGYDCSLTFENGTAPDGTAYQAVQRNIRINHLAIVDRARGGPTLRIGDTLKGGIAWLKKAIARHERHMSGKEATSDASQQKMMEEMKMALAELEGGPAPKMKMGDSLHGDSEMTTKTMLIDGLTVDISNADTAQATIATILAARDAANAKGTEQATQLAAKDTEIATLKTEKKALEDAKPTPAQLRDAAKTYAQVADKAKALGVTVTDAMDEPAIMRAVVDAKMGETAKDWTADAVAASFAVLAKDVKAIDSKIVPIGMPQSVTDTATIRDRIRDARNAA